ncbi:MAG: hypothetical protein ACRDJG_08880 [Actinomycetota bacterium]
MTSEEPGSAPRPAGEPVGGPSGGVAADERPSEGAEGVGATGESDGPSSKEGGVRPRRGPRWVPLVGAIVVGAVVLFGASYFVATRLFRRPAPGAPSAARSPTPGSNPQSPANFVTFRDEEAGISISYPKTWTRFRKPGDEQVKLAAGVRDSGDLFLLRVIPLDKAIPPTAVFSLKNEFDRLIGAEKLNIIKQEQMTLNGLVGWHYLYTFGDDAGRETGFKSHYLLANGAKIDVLVFQAFPKADFKGLARTFDQIAGTFASTPRAEPQPAPSPGG